MPIKIVITDPSSLTQVEINDLRDYLLIAARNATQEATIKDANDFLPTLQDVVKNDTPKAESKVRKKRTPPPPPLKDLPTQPLDEDAFREHCNPVDGHLPIFVKDCPPPPAIEPPVAGATLMQDGDWMNPEEPEISYEELVAYVLEITRTKKADYQAAMLLIQKYGLMNLNELANSPHLINPLYRSLKELVNASER
jgi:hypothetical protein